jgi:hypothetical protein
MTVILRRREQEANIIASDRAGLDAKYFAK